MPETDESLLRIVNAMGFLFQQRIEQEVIRLHHDISWSILAREKSWTDPTTSKEAYIDLVLESRAMRMVVECKKVDAGNWIFLIGDGKLSMHRARLLWTELSDAKERKADWDEFKLGIGSPESEFCIVRGQGKDDSPMLERIASRLTRCTEALADQEFELYSRPVTTRNFYYIPAIVTNATLWTCSFSPEDVDIYTGKLDAEDAGFKAVPMVRFRKSLSTNLASRPRSGSETLKEVSSLQQRTVLVINSGHIGSILTNIRELSRFGY